jgi:hypothetical protein
VLVTDATVALSHINFGFPKLGKGPTRRLIEQLADLRSRAGDA